MKFFEVRSNQQVTNQLHGGFGWELGTCLWSPERSKSGGDVWKAMRQIRPGDLVIHSCKFPGGHQLVGYSYAKDHYYVTESEPPFPDRWENYGHYYRVDLENYCSVKHTPIKQFLISYHEVLKVKNLSGQFYDSNFQTAQKYLVVVDRLVLQYLDEFFFHQFGTANNTNPLLFTEHKDDITPNQPPDRKTVSVDRIIRDTKLVRELKESYRCTCQICGHSILLPNGKRYAEGHHLKPLGGVHAGPDVKENIVILCPYHHAEFDYGSIAIKNDRVVHIDSLNPYHKKQLHYIRQDLSHEFLSYHLKHIFNQSK